jgi:2,4-dienoyl-CoA reductase-like NADH-dependent reductase (Old Yellow Enzyme family)/thioredoxin reductase
MISKANEKNAAATGGKPAFAKLSEPISIGPMTVKNRLVVPAMGTGFATPDGLVTQQLLDYYEARAKGGAGMVIVETTSVDFPRGIHASNRMVIDNDATLPGLAALAAVIQKHGARAIMQLNHAGRLGKSKVSGIQPVAPSPIPAPGGQMPRELSIDEIARIVALFAQAARRARKAGFDGVELHAAHGYLLATFSSPCSNRRTDRYGGSVENRARMLVEVLTAIRQSVGDEYPLWCRINAREYGAPDGLTLEDGRSIARRVNGLVSAISVSARGYGLDSLVNYPDEPGAMLPLAAEIRKVVSVPVIAVGRMTPEVAERAIAAGHADLIAQGRQSIADPETPNKIFSGRLDDIRPCIACFYCADAGAQKDSHIGCQVNAALGREREYEIRPARAGRKIVVVGAGPAGLEASRVLAQRGHKVTLLEKEAILGGQLALAAIPPHKERLKPLLTYFETQLKKLDVDIRLNTEASRELIGALGADAVIVAAGSSPAIPPIAGIGGDNVVSAVDVLAGKARVGNAVVVIGGGSTGCETAEFLHERGCATTVIEMLPGLALETGNNERTRMLNRITALPIAFLTGTQCLEIRADGVSVRAKDGAERFVGADTVVLACGVRPNNALFQEIHDAGIEAHMAGDCWHPDVIARAVSDGARLGHLL